MSSKFRPGYVSHPRLPEGWAMLQKGEGKTYFLNKEGKFLKNRRNVLAEMYKIGKFSETEVEFIRDGLTSEGWQEDTALPKYWMFKQYSHKIEGVESDVLYLLSPWGTIFRSKTSLKKYCKENSVNNEDFQKLINFKPEYGDESKRLMNPDDTWVYDSEFVPAGWKFKKYTFNSKAMSNKVEEVHVYHYLTPEGDIIRGKKQIYDYMIETNTYNSIDFQKFHFNKRKSSKKGRQLLISWSNWVKAEGFPNGWEVREGTYKYQKKVQYRSPRNTVFHSKVKALKHVDSDLDCQEGRQEYQELISGNGRIVDKGVQDGSWGEWRSDYIPSLPGWMFSIGQKDCKRVIRYKSPSGEVFMSRGSLIRYLNKNNMRTTQQLLTLKKLLKTNQAKHFEDLRRNDKFIKNMEADMNYLLFLKIRYENHHVIEVEEDRLPDGWKMKMINGVEYFKDPTGDHVFNSRRLVVEYLRCNRLETEEDVLRDILEDSDVDSDLSESDVDDADKV